MEVWSCASTGGAQRTLKYGRPERSFPLSGWAPGCSCGAAFRDAVKDISKYNREPKKPPTPAMKKHCSDDSLQVSELWGVFNLSATLAQNCELLLSYRARTHPIERCCISREEGVASPSPPWWYLHHNKAISLSSRRKYSLSPLRLCVVIV